jgi:hypothetical protein
MAATGRKPWRRAPWWVAGAHKRKGLRLRGFDAGLSQRGLKADCRVVWKFIDDDGLCFKKCSGQQAPDAPGSSVPRIFNRIVLARSVCIETSEAGAWWLAIIGIAKQKRYASTFASLFQTSMPK